MFNGNLIKQSNLLVHVTSVMQGKHRVMFNSNLIMKSLSDRPSL